MCKRNIILIYINFIYFLMDKAQFSKIFSKNFKKIVSENFNSQQECAEAFNEKQQNISRWSSGGSLPDLYKIYNICKSLNISIDYLVNEGNYEITKGNVDYTLFNEVFTALNKFASKHHIKLKGEDYLKIYENFAHLKQFNQEITINKFLETFKSFFTSK